MTGGDSEGLPRPGSEPEGVGAPLALRTGAIPTRMSAELCVATVIALGFVAAADCRAPPAWRGRRPRALAAREASPYCWTMAATARGGRGMAVAPAGHPGAQYPRDSGWGGAPVGSHGESDWLSAGSDDLRGGGSRRQSTPASSIGRAKPGRPRGGCTGWLSRPSSPLGGRDGTPLPA